VVARQDGDTDRNGGRTEADAQPGSIDIREHRLPEGLVVPSVELPAPSGSVAEAPSSPRPDKDGLLTDNRPFPRSSMSEFPVVNARPVIETGIYQGGQGLGQDRAVVGGGSAGEDGDHVHDSWWTYGVLSDGAGGAGDGARAAESVINAFARSLEASLRRFGTPENDGNPPEHLRQAIWHASTVAHDEVRSLSKDPLLRGSAATLEAAVVIPTLGGARHTGIVIHVGDGMIWTLGEDGLSRDRKLAAPSTHSRSLGGSLKLQGQVLWLPLRPRQQLLLTSDGFEAGLQGFESKAFARANALATHLYQSRASAAETASCLGGLAAANAQDDVTVVVIGSRL
jgi:serine/threonine protein phosphatase PrpC